MEDSSHRHQKIGEILLSKHKITQEQLEEALRVQKKTGERLGEVLRKMGLVESQEIYQALAEQVGAPYVDLDSYVIDPRIVTLLPEKFCRQNQVVPVAEEGRALILAMANPVDVVTLDRVRLMTKREVRPVVATPQDIEKVLDAYYGVGESVEELIREAETREALVFPEGEEELKIDQLVALGEEAPIVRVVNMIILQAIRSGASDIHIEPQEDQVRIRFRIDGILHDITSTSIRVHPAISSRIKILSRMNIAERRLPQDGRFQVTVNTRTVDFRVSSLPTVFGEKIVMRILDKSALLLDLGLLGFEEEDLEKFSNLLKHPYGMILLTGPTGSGKTTTLYSALNFINKPDINIITIEDPVEYHLPGINQVQVRPKIGLTFANALRSILRQDPDVIMVGEIRDYETAEIAIHAALTGHLVFSTLHTNTAAGALVRLQEMGIPSYLVASALLGVVAQRLVRKICERCKEAFEVEGPVALELTGGKKDRLVLYRGRGCPDCNKTGYRGRIAVNEVLVPDDEIRSMVLHNATEKELTEKAREKGMKTLWENAVRKVLRGVTTLEEMYRVTSKA